MLKNHLRKLILLAAVAISSISFGASPFVGSGDQIIEIMNDSEIIRKVQGKFESIEYVNSNSDLGAQFKLRTTEFVLVPGSNPSHWNEQECVVLVFLNYTDKPHIVARDFSGCPSASLK